MELYLISLIRLTAVLTISRKSELEIGSSSSQTPTLNNTAALIESTTRAKQATLRDQVRQREGHKCALTGFFNPSYVEMLYKEKRLNELPVGARIYPMVAAHIIPFSLNKFKFNEKSSQELVR